MGPVFTSDKQTQKRKPRTVVSVHDVELQKLWRSSWIFCFEHSALNKSPGLDDRDEPERCIMARTKVDASRLVERMDLRCGNGDRIILDGKLRMIIEVT